MELRDVVVSAGNPHDWMAGELDALVDLINRASGLDVWVDERHEDGYGVSLMEVIHLFVPWETVDSAVIDTVISTSVAWCMGRCREDRDAAPESPVRKRSIVIWDRNGRALKSVTVDESAVEADDGRFSGNSENFGRPAPGPRTS